jgi:ATP-dependent Clp protease ATP-binding subunit ClpA
MVKSDLGRGRIRVIGATTNAEFRLIESDAALARRFQVVPVKELTPEQTIEILGAKVAKLEQHHGVSVTRELLPIVVDLSIRYVSNRHLPDKALDLLDESCAFAKLATTSRGEGFRRPS